MKGFEKFLLIIFSVVIVVIVAFVILGSTEMINLRSILSAIANYLIQYKVITLSISSLFALLAIFGLFSSSESSDERKTGLAIKSETGTVYITKETFESIILAVARNYAELKNIKVDTSVTPEGIVANVYALILPDTVVPTLTAKLQENIKANVLKQTTVEIKEANIKIKGVYIEPQKK